MAKSASIGAVLPPAIPPPPPAEATGQDAYVMRPVERTHFTLRPLAGLLENNAAILQYPTLEELVAKLSMDLGTLHDAILHLEQQSISERPKHIIILAALKPKLQPP